MTSHSDRPAQGVELLRENLARLVRDVNAADPRELAQSLFADDGETALGLVEALPRLLEVAADAVSALCGRLESIPPERAAEVVDSALSRVDGKALGEAVNSLSRLMIRLHEQDPGLLARRRLDIASGALRAVDFGKLRKALAYRAEERLQLMLGEVEALGNNPVAMVNIASVLPKVINQALKVLQKLLDMLVLPAEAMTYALFNILEDVDWKGVAGVINGAAGVVVNLHRGSLILGEGSPYSATSFSRIGSELVEDLDGPLLAEAVAALGQEGEALVSSLVERALQDKAMAVSLLEAALSLVNACVRASASLCESLRSLPPETMRGMAVAVERGLDTEGLGRMLLSLRDLANGMREVNPGLISRIAREVVDFLKAERTSLVSYRNLAERVNRGLRSFNSRVAKGAAPGAVAGDFLERLDYAELDRAAGNAASLLSDTLGEHPELAGIFLKAIATIIYHTIKGYLAGRLGRLRGRR